MHESSISSTSFYFTLWNWFKALFYWSLNWNSLDMWVTRCLFVCLLTPCNVIFEEMPAYWFCISLLNCLFNFKSSLRLNLRKNIWKNSSAYYIQLSKLCYLCFQFLVEGNLPLLNNSIKAASWSSYCILNNVSNFA